MSEMHQIRFPASVCLYVRPSVRLLDGVRHRIKTELNRCELVLFVILFIVVRSRRTVTTASAEVIGLSVDFGGAMVATNATTSAATITIK